MSIVVQIIRIAVLIGLLLPISASCMEDRVKRTGMFSSMVYNHESGDVNGTEIFIMYSSEGYFAVTQVSIGMPSAPMVSKVEWINNQNCFKFILPKSKFRSGFVIEGEVKKDGIEAEMVSPNGVRKPLVLPRRKSYWD